MALDVTPVNRNLHTRVTFMALEFEDLFVVLGLAALMNVVSRFVSGGMGAVLQCVLRIFDRLMPGHNQSWLDKDLPPETLTGVESLVRYQGGS